MISLLYLLIGLSLVSGQAPGDYTPKCREGNNAAEHIFPAEWRILMDTFDYENLFDPFIRNPAWTTLDADGDGNTWSSAVGGVCSGAPYVCVLTAPQNNWIFSQFIRYTAANEVFFNIKYDFSSCVLNPSCTNDFMTLYRYDQNSMTNNNDRTDIMNYNTPMFGTIASSRLEASGSASTLTKNESLVPTNNFNGFYMGIEDVGTCGQISRIIIYYLVCPAKVTGLVKYNEIAVPLRAASNVVYSASCVANAHNVTNLEVTIYSANSTCIDEAFGGARCECNHGYFLFNTSHCEACSAGTYLSLTDTSCQTCPANTEKDVVAAAECACLSGFYRNDSPQEGPEIGCTAPPGPCEDLQVMLVTDTTVTLAWNRPINIGRSDLFYKVWHSDPDNIGEFVAVNSNLVDSGASVSYIVSNGLMAFRSYIFRVTTHNGVSDQDPDAHLRISEITTTTLEGLPGQPGNVQRLCTVVVWQAPSQPNGIITRYDVNFQPGTTRMLSAPTSFYLTTTEERHPDTIVKVRAVSGAGAGPWSSGEPVGCTDGATCPVLPTNPPPTCPTSTPDTNALHFELGERSYLNNTVVLLEDIGENTDALLCVTNHPTCCSSGEFYYPNGSQVPLRNKNQDFYRNRGTQLVRLNRRNNAMSPTGSYRCVIQDANGVNQNLFISIVSRDCPTVMPPLTTPTCSPCESCPTTPVTVMTDAPTCPTCPTVPTCPPTLPPPTLPPTSPPSIQTALHFELGGRSYLNNTVVVLEDIGENTDALLCVTNHPTCCTSGEFYYPDGSRVPTRSSGQDFYRNRGTQLIRLHRRNNAMSPTGTYHCVIQDENGVDQNLFIDIVSRDCPTVMPPTTTPTCSPCESCPTTPVTVTTDAPTCPMCPIVPTCPPTMTPPTLPPTSIQTALHFELGGRSYLNNTVVVLEDIGENTDALLCVTNHPTCCSTGEFYYPNGSQVPVRRVGHDFYRNRGSQRIRLNRRNNAMSPTGTYLCVIQDENGVDQNLFIDIVSRDCPTVMPPTTAPTCSPCESCPTTPVTVTTDAPTCPMCPIVPTCPPTMTPPTLPPTSIQTELHFELGGRSYLNNTVVVLEDIGENTDALLCVTNHPTCCSSGEFYYPNGSQVPLRNKNQDFYRNRGTQLVRLNRRNNAVYPTGTYRCVIQDASGVDQNLFINIVATEVPTSTPCPDSPTCSCPTCSTCSCPTPDPPTLPPTTACPTCPACPPTVTCPPPATTTPPSQLPELHFELGGRIYRNNTRVVLEDIGENTEALLCVTKHPTCCTSGEFYYPNGSQVPLRNKKQDFYRNRGTQLVRLNRRNNAESPTGTYRCVIQDASGVEQNLSINIVSSSVPNCPGSLEGISCSISDSVQVVMDIIETATSYVLGLSYFTSSDSIEVVFTENNGPGLTKRQEKRTVFKVMVDTAPNKSLINIDKSKINNILLKGRLYTIQIGGVSSSSVTPFTFRFTEAIITEPATCFQVDLSIYILIPVFGVVLLVLITVAIIVVYICKKYKKKNSDIKPVPSWYKKSKMNNNALCDKYSTKEAIELNDKAPQDKVY